MGMLSQMYRELGVDSPFPLKLYSIYIISYTSQAFVYF